MTLQQYLSTLPCLPLPTGNPQTPFLSIPWCYLVISSSAFLSFLLLSLSLSSLLLPSSPSYSFHCPCHLFFCLPLLLVPFTVHIISSSAFLSFLFLSLSLSSLLLPSSSSCSFHCPLQNCLRHARGSCFRFFIMVRRSSCTPVAFWILVRPMVFVGNVQKIKIRNEILWEQWKHS